MLRSRRPTATQILPILAATVAGVVALVVIATACAKSIDTAKLQTNIADEANKKGMKVTAVDCGQSRPAKQGDTFQCRVTLEAGGTVVYDVSQTTDAGDVTYQLAANQAIEGAKVAATLRQDISQGGADATITCPQIVLTPGGVAEFDCNVDASGQSAMVHVKVKDGKVDDWQLKASESN